MNTSLGRSNWHIRLGPTALLPSSSNNLLTTSPCIEVSQVSVPPFSNLRRRAPQRSPWALPYPAEPKCTSRGKFHMNIIFLISIKWEKPMGKAAWKFVNIALALLPAVRLCAERQYLHWGKWMLPQPSRELFIWRRFQCKNFFIYFTVVKLYHLNSCMHFTFPNNNAY